MKKLFDVSSPKKDIPVDKKENNVETKNEPQPVTEKKKRGRPKKFISDPVPENETKKKEKTTKQVKEKSVVVSDAKPDNGWKDYLKSKPEPLVPCEFYVDTGKEKKDIFTGYLMDAGCTVTDEPYKLVVMRNKYGNLFYREIKGCSDIRNCPNEFPKCSKCPIAKRKLIK